jgi:hypothetical protein
MAKRKKQPRAKQPDPRTDVPRTEVSAADFEPYSQCEQRLTAAQVRAIRNMAYHRACLMRAEGHWSEEEEAAFLNGVACAFFACQSQTDLPALWYLDALPLLERLARLKARGLLVEGA